MHYVKGEAMIKCIYTSTEQWNKFTKEVPIDFGFQIKLDSLPASTWPARGDTIAVPAQILKFCHDYQQHYTEQHDHRILTFDPMYSTASLQVTFGVKTYQLRVNFYQMSVITLYNVTKYLTFAEIRNATKIDNITLIDIMESLTGLNYNILTIKFNTFKKFDYLTDTYEWNDEFKSKKRRIDLLHVYYSLIQHKPEYDSLVRLIEAAVVRLMKKNKSMHFRELYTEVKEVLKCRMSVTLIDVKKRIEGLIDRGFMERDSNDHTLFHYIA